MPAFILLHCEWKWLAVTTPKHKKAFDNLILSRYITKAENVSLSLSASPSEYTSSETSVLDVVLTFFPSLPVSLSSSLGYELAPHAFSIQCKMQNLYTNDIWFTEEVIATRGLGWSTMLPETWTKHCKSRLLLSTLATCTRLRKAESDQHQKERAGLATRKAYACNLLSSSANVFQEMHPSCTVISQSWVCGCCNKLSPSLSSRTDQWNTQNADWQNMPITVLLFCVCSESTKSSRSDQQEAVEDRRKSIRL